jgi:hypothetical protein
MNLYAVPLSTAIKMLRQNGVGDVGGGPAKPPLFRMRAFSATSVCSRKAPIAVHYRKQ